MCLHSQRHHKSKDIKMAWVTIVSLPLDKTEIMLVTEGVWPNIIQDSKILLMSIIGWNGFRNDNSEYLQKQLISKMSTDRVIILIMVIHNNKSKVNKIPFTKKMRKVLSISISHKDFLKSDWAKTDLQTQSRLQKIMRCVKEPDLL